MPQEIEVPRDSPIALAQHFSAADQFPGVDEALRARGVEAILLPLEERAHRLGAGTRVVAVSDVRAFEALHILRQARRAGACSLLLMDGICEYRNTFLNPRVGADFLRPAPVDVIACAGRDDADRLRELGNDAVPTGLPRLGAITPMQRPRAPAVMVATARQPAFSDGERARLVACLRALRDRLRALGVQARWRLTGGLDVDLQVPPDRAPLLQSLAAVSAVMTTPSTLLVEAMRAGRPVALLHPFDAPCWPRAAWLLEGGAAEDGSALEATVRALLDPSPGDVRTQAEVLAAMHNEDAPAAEALADLLIGLAERPRRRSHPARLLDPTRLPDRVPARPDRLRVVSMVRCDASGVGGIATWSRRLALALAAERAGYDVRTLLVATHPDAVPRVPGAKRSVPQRTSTDLGHGRCASLAPGTRDELTSICVVDPADHWEAVCTVRAALERLEPSIVLPNNADLCYAAAMQLRWHGVRTVAVAHTECASARQLVTFYDRWDGAAGVSRACMDWLAPMAGDRPVAWIRHSPGPMARRCRELFDAVMARPMDRTPSDAGLRLCEPSTWRKEWVERPDEAMRWIEAGLREAGYRSIALDEPTRECDAVILRAGGSEPVEERVAALRRAGLGVAVWPHLFESPVADRMHRAARVVVEEGCRRLAIYGIGPHTRRSAGIFDRGLPFVGFIDDGPVASKRIFGLPIVSVDRALQELDPDAVLLSSETWEEQLWRRSAPLRRAGVRVIPLYGTYSE